MTLVISFFRLKRRNMESLVQLILDKFYEEERTGEMERQLEKIVQMEDRFVKEFSKEKWKEYFDLDLEVGFFHVMEIDQVIRVAIKVIKEIYK